MFDQILSDQEKAKLEAFAKDRTLLEAVRKVLLFGIYNNGTLKPGEKVDPGQNFALSLAFANDGTLSDEQIGQDVRAAVRGIRLVEGAFKEFEKFAPKSAKPEKVGLNKAI